MKHIGFTGSQKGMTQAAGTVLNDMLNDLDEFTFHHGQCVGADCYAFMIAKRFNQKIIFHPPLNEQKMFYMTAEFYYDLDYEKREPKDYLVRNHEMVDECEILFACPNEMEEVLRSGTWATIRYAVKNNKKVLIIYPDGTTEHNFTIGKK